VSDPPIVLDKRTIDLPAATTDSTIECLVVDGESRDAEQEICFWVAPDVRAIEAGEIAPVAYDPEAILKCFGADVHLVVAEVNAHSQVMLVADQFNRIFERKDIRSPLKRRVSAIAERPIASRYDRRNQAATIRSWKTGSRSRWTSKVRVRNATGYDCCGGAGAITNRLDVVKYAVITKRGLVDRRRRENVTLANRYVRAWFKMYSLLPNAFDSANPGDPPGTNE